MRKYTTREWVQLIVILSLIEFVILIGAHFYCDKDSVIGYISFAGTIVSIILAVIAIIYSFFQSISQARNENNISTQVDRLIETTNTIIDSTKKLSEDLNSLEIIKETLFESHKAILSVDNKYSDLKNIFSSMNNNINNTDNSEIENKESDVSDVNNVIFRNPNNMFAISVLVAKKVSEDKNDYFDSGKDIIASLASILVAEDKGGRVDNLKFMLTGGYIAVVNLLIALNYFIVSKDNLITLSEIANGYCDSLIEQFDNNTIESGHVKNTIKYLFNR